jgi:hypothetical protein
MPDGPKGAGPSGVHLVGRQLQPEVEPQPSQT